MQKMSQASRVTVRLEIKLYAQCLNSLTNAEKFVVQKKPKHFIGHLLTYCEIKLSKFADLIKVQKSLYNIDCKPSFYIRFVDDIFAVFQDDTTKLAFFEHLNKLHSSLRFTMEEGTDRLPFLDTEVRISKTGVETALYRKPTHTGVFLNYAALVPWKWKFGLVFCLIHRAYVICSNPMLFQQEISKLRESTKYERGSKKLRWAMKGDYFFSFYN